MELIQQGAKASKKVEKDNWQTPWFILDAVKNFYKGVGLEMIDPCPANPDFDAFEKYRPSPPKGFGYYINPPFSQYKKWSKYFRVGVPAHYPEQIWMCHHNHDTKWFANLINGDSVLMCMFFKRVKFIDPFTREPSNSTAIGKCQSLIYTGKFESKFRKCFKELGYIALI